jgi:hypothetical protein
MPSVNPRSAHGNTHSMSWGSGMSRSMEAPTAAARSLDRGKRMMYTHDEMRCVAWRQHEQAWSSGEPEAFQASGQAQGEGEGDEGWQKEEVTRRRAGGIAPCPMV